MTFQLWKCHNFWLQEHISRFPRQKHCILTFCNKNEQQTDFYWFSTMEMLWTANVCTIHSHTSTYTNNSFSSSTYPIHSFSYSFSSDGKCSFIHSHGKCLHNSQFILILFWNLFTIFKIAMEMLIYNVNVFFYL